MQTEIRAAVVQNGIRSNRKNFWDDGNLLYQFEWQLHSHLHLSNIIELNIQHRNMSLKANYTSVKVNLKSFVHLMRFSMPFRMIPKVPVKVAIAPLLFLQASLCEAPGSLHI